MYCMLDCRFPIRQPTFRLTFSLRPHTMNRHIRIRPIRYFHSTRRLNSDFVAEPFNIKSLKVRLNSTIFQSGNKVTDQTALHALTACSKLIQIHNTTASADSPSSKLSSDEPEELLKKVLINEDIPLTLDTLRQFLLSKPTYDSCITAMKAFHKKKENIARNTYIPAQVSMIPFRRAVYNAEFEKAFTFIDLSVNMPSYKRMIRDEWFKYAGFWTGCTASILSGVELLLQSGLVGTWTSTYMVHLMALTYLSSITIYTGLAFGGRVSGAGEVLRWSQGTLTTHWFSHAQEMRMCSLLADMNRQLPENQGECTLQLRKDLMGRQMTVIEMEDETLLKEYWARSGEGFEWVEPDQDPAELIWRTKMQQSQAKRLQGGSPYSNKPDNFKYNESTGRYEWTYEMTLPHASLIDTGKKELLRADHHPQLPQ